MYMSPNAIWPFMEKFIFQHAPALCIQVIQAREMYYSHDDVSKCLKYFSLEWFCEEITNHFRCQKMYYIEFTLLNSVLYEEISYVDVS